MATFTMELREVLKHTDDIGLENYPIFDDAYRQPLNQKIIDHFLFREIGTETIDMFTHFMARKMNEIMPLYNQLYKSAALEIDPFVTFRTSSTSRSAAETADTTQGTSDSTNTGTTDSTSRTVASELPQTRLSGDGDYATAANDAVSRTEAGGTSTNAERASREGRQSGEATSTAEGFSGTMARMLLEYRQTFLNIDMLIIEELEPLFMQLWDNGTNFSRGNSFGVMGGWY